MKRDKTPKPVALMRYARKSEPIVIEGWIARLTRAITSNERNDTWYGLNDLDRLRIYARVLLWKEKHESGIRQDALGGPHTE